MSVNDLTMHYFAAVGELLDLATVGKLRVALVLDDGALKTGVPRPMPGMPVMLDETGHERSFRLNGDVIDLASVRRATLLHPDDGVAVSA